MADEDEELDTEDFEDEEEAKTGGKKWLIIAILLVVLLGGGAAAFFLLAGGDDAEEATPEEVAAEAPADTGDGAQLDKDGKVVGGPVFFEMPEFLVNLSSPGGKASFLKMKVTLELKKQSDLPIVESYMPRIVDNFNTYLRELRATDLSGSAGLYRLREEMLMRINQFIAPAKVENILFKEIVVQ